MDKETLSNYGWIVILVLVLSVLLALATPFGLFITDAIKAVKDIAAAAVLFWGFGFFANEIIALGSKLIW